MARRISSLTFTAIACVCVACDGARWVVVDTSASFGPGIATVSGRVDDPHGLRTPDMLLALNRQTEDGASGIYVRLAADGSFATPPLPGGSYSLEIIRTPYSATHPATAMGVAWVEVGTVDVSGVVVPVRRDMELVGRYRIDTDRADPQWPASIHVSAPLVVNGVQWWSSTQVTHGAPGGRFILRNAYGPRVLLVGYTPTTGDPPAPVRVLLDGRDITDVPTDFSEHVGSDLEVVITERPPRLVGMVTDVVGR